MTVDEHIAACERMIEAAAEDSGMDPDEFWCDIVRAYELTELGNAPAKQRREFCRRYGLDYRP